MWYVKRIYLASLLWVAMLALVIVPTMLHAQTLNDEAPGVQLLVGVENTATQNSGRAIHMHAQLSGSMPVVVGTESSRKILGRLVGEAKIGIRTATPDQQGETVTPPDAASVGDVSQWAAFALKVGYEFEIGAMTFPEDEPDERPAEIRMGLIGFLGGSTPIDTMADVEPRLAKMAAVGLAFHEVRSGARIVIGAGENEEGIPSAPIDPVTGETARVLQAYIGGLIPIPKLGHTAWLTVDIWAHLLHGVDDGRRDILSVGITVDPGAILKAIK
jgi:hypothetical protein